MYLKKKNWIFFRNKITSKFLKEHLIRRKCLNSARVLKEDKKYLLEAEWGRESTCISFGMGCKYWLPRSLLKCPTSPTAEMHPRREHVCTRCMLVKSMTHLFATLHLSRALYINVQIAFVIFTFTLISFSGWNYR